MKRLGLFLLAVVMVAGLAGCPKKDKDYNFNGIWLIQSHMVSQVCNWNLGTGRVQIVQNGDSLTWQYLDYAFAPVPGSCDPGNGSLYVRYTFPSGMVVIINGLAEDIDTMSGTRSGTMGNCSYTANFTLELISR